MKQSQRHDPEPSSGGPVVWLRSLALILMWLGGTFILDVVLTILPNPLKSALPRLAEEAVNPILWMWYAASLVLTSPLLRFALNRGRAREIRVARADLVARSSAGDVDDLGELPPDIQRLITSARTIRVSLEAPDDGGFRAAWQWQGELRQLSEADRRQLERAGLGQFDVTRLAEVGSLGGWRRRRAAKRLRIALAEFERELLSSAFVDPYR